MPNCGHVRQRPNVLWYLCRRRGRTGGEARDCTRTSALVGPIDLPRLIAKPAAMPAQLAAPALKGRWRNGGLGGLARPSAPSLRRSAGVARASAAPADW